MSLFIAGSLAAHRARVLATLVAILCLVSARSSSAVILINEVCVNPPGSDDGREFIELISTTGGVELMAGHVLLIVDSEGSGIGKIMDAYKLENYLTGTNGLLMMGEAYDVAVPGPLAGPWNSVYDPATTLKDPSGDIPYSGLSFPDDLTNNAFTMFLVQGFSGSVDDDLDSDNNGVLDVTPWTTIVDSVGWKQSGGIDKTYALADLSQATLTPDSVARLNGNTTPNSAAAWYGGDLNTAIGGTTLQYDPIKNFGFPSGATMTPGYVNYPTVPEPSSVLLAAFGALGLVGMTVRRKAR